MESHGATSEHDTATLDRFNEVLGRLCNEAKPRLMGVEFQCSSQGLLGDHGQIISVVQKDPGRCIRNGSDSADKFGETLPDRRDAPIIGTAEAEGHGVLMRGIRDTLRRQLLCYPCVGEQGFPDTGWTAYDNMWRISEFGTKKGDRLFLA
jgi:hypothetical protein